MPPRQTPPPTKTCDARVCRHCRPLDTRGVERPQPLTVDDLRWLWQEAESALGVRSTHGAFVDMALAGPPTGGGGRTNGVEARAVEGWRLDAVARERCIRHRLADVPSEALAVLRAAYGPEDWTACHSQVNLRAGQTPNPLTAPEVFSAARDAWAAEVLRLAPLTPIARGYETRKRLVLSPAGEPLVVYGREEKVAGIWSHRPVRCVYRPGPTAPAPRPSRPRKEAGAEPVTARQALAQLFERDPLLARSSRGAALSAACGVCPGCGLPGKCDAVAAIGAQARDLLQRAREVAGIRTEHVPAPRIRAVRHEEPPPAPLSLPSDAEVLANG